MEKNLRSLSVAEQLLTKHLRSLQMQMERVLKGNEKEILFNLVRVLDTLAVEKYLQNTDSPQNAAAHNVRFFALHGAAAALKPALQAVRNVYSGVPYAPISEQSFQAALMYLVECGKLTYMIRLAALEHRGLTACNIAQDGTLHIKSLAGAAELSQTSAMQAWQAKRKPPPSKFSEFQWANIRKKMHRFVNPKDGWFIRYENTMHIVEAYREVARGFGLKSLEAEAFPGHVKIGDRTFGEWKEACDMALGRVLCHIDFAHLLQKKNPSTHLANVHTLWSFYPDPEGIWVEAGLKETRLKSTMAALTLSADSLEDWEESFETPCPYYIDFGKGVVLLPLFGALANPYFALFRHLRTVYTNDWQANVDTREAIFRTQLAEAFPSDKFLIPAHGFKLKREDGSISTDIDAVVVDRHCGTLALVQLKWYDIFGTSVKERDSRRNNIADARKWIEKVHTWVNGRSNALVAKALGLKALGSDAAPHIYVLARYAARFSDDNDKDERAAWLTWPEVLEGSADLKDSGNLLADLPNWVVEKQALFAQAPEQNIQHRLSTGLEVHLQVVSEM